MADYGSISTWNDQIGEIMRRMSVTISYHDESLQSAFDKLAEAQCYIEAELKLRDAAALKRDLNLKIGLLEMTNYDHLLDCSNLASMLIENLRTLPACRAITEAIYKVIEAQSGIAEVLRALEARKALEVKNDNL